VPAQAGQVCPRPEQAGPRGDLPGSGSSRSPPRLATRQPAAAAASRGPKPRSGSGELPAAGPGPFRCQESPEVILSWRASPQITSSLLHRPSSVNRLRLQARAPRRRRSCARAHALPRGLAASALPCSASLRPRSRCDPTGRSGPHPFTPHFQFSSLPVWASCERPFLVIFTFAFPFLVFSPLHILMFNSTYIVLVSFLSPPLRRKPREGGFWLLCLLPFLVASDSAWSMWALSE
jgi:hypothetical protein